MKLLQLQIRNFRGIERLDLDFRDYLGRPRDKVLLVGPNTCGKTTVLDAIAACLGPTLELPAARPDFRPHRIVRRGAVRAEVTCTLFLSGDEIAAVAEIARLSEQPWRPPEDGLVTVHWQYPYSDADRDYPWGYNSFEPHTGWRLLKGRVLVARHLHAPGIDLRHFTQVGGVFTFDQQRTGMSKVIPPDILAAIGHANMSGDEANGRTTDPRLILLAMAVKSNFANVDPTAPDEFAVVKEAYARVCAPHAMLAPVLDERGDLDPVFSDGEAQYRYDGLSSGEQMVLQFLLRFVSERIHRSIVLVDEVELHQHPAWQRRLLSMLPEMGEDNQFILTTHSAYIRDMTPQSDTVFLGDLGDAGNTRGEP